MSKLKGCQFKTKLFFANFLCYTVFSQKLTYKKALKTKSISGSSPDRFSLRFKSMLKIKPVLQGLAKQLVWHQHWAFAFINALFFFFKPSNYNASIFLEGYRTTFSIIKLEKFLTKGEEEQSGERWCGVLKWELREAVNLSPTLLQ